MENETDPLKKRPKLTRRKVLGFSALTIAGAITSKLFYPAKIGRKLASQLGIDPSRIGYSFLKTLKVKEYKLTSRILIKLGAIKNKKKYDKGHNTRMYSHLEEYINYGNLNSVKWSMADEIKNSEDFRKSNAENFYIRTEKPNQLTHEIKEIKVSGLIDKDFNLDTDYFFQNSKDQGMVMMECAGNDRLARFRLMSAAQWSGVPLEELITKDKNGFSFFGLTRVDNEATHVHVEGFDETTNTNWKKLFGVRSKPGASWIFTIDELIKQKAFIATHMNGEKLTGDHGHPIRLVVPGFYGCASIKWLTNIAFFKATNKTPTESQMREFSDRTGQTGVPKLYNNHRSPIIELSAMMITVEKWKTLESKIRYRFIGVMWGAVDEANHQLTIEIRKKNKKNKLIQVGNVQALPRDNTRSFHTWSYWWDEPEKGYFTVDLVSANAKISTRRLDNKHYRRVVCIKAV